MDFLSKHKYAVEIREEKDGCSVFFPKYKSAILNRESFVATYRILKGKRKGVEKRITDINVPLFISLPSYASRIFIYVDICAECYNINFDKRLVSIYDKNSKLIANDTSMLFEILKTPRESKSENFLFDLIVRSIDDGFDVKYQMMAEENGVLEGYLALSKILLESNS